MLLRRLLLLFPLALLLGVLFSGEIRDNDIFWHLRTGRYIVETHRLPVPDPFSWTSTGSAYPGEEVTRRFNLTHEWLSQVALYLTYLAAGFPGLVAARILVLIAFCSLTGWVVYRRTTDYLLSLAAVLASAAMAFYFAQSRPFLATFFFLALTVAILESGRRLWVLPFLFVIWANCHSGFILGWVACLAYAVNSRKFWLPGAVAILASGLNPNGFRILPVLLSYRVSAIQTNNLEWQKPIFWNPGIFSFLLFGSLLLLLISWRRARFTDWLLYVAFAAISLTAVRNTIFLGLVGPIVIATYLPRRRFLAPAALTFGSAALILFDIVPAAAAHNTFAFRPAAWQLPEGAAFFIEAHGLRARLFNSYEDGGYLLWRLWPLDRVFIDGRGLSEQAFADYRRILYDTSGGATAAGLITHYGIQLLVLPGFDYLSGQVYPVAVNLTSQLIYADATSLVFMPHPPPGITPLPNPETALLAGLSTQCETHVAHDPLHPRCAFGLAELYAARNDTDRARQWISYYLDRRTAPDPEAEEMRQSLTVTALNTQATALQAQGDLLRAEPLFRQALAIAQNSLGPDRPETAGALNNLAALLEAKGDYPEAESLFRRALAICERKFGPADPRTALALDNLAGVLEAQGDTRAEALYRRALTVAEQSLGPGSPDTDTIRRDLDDYLRTRPR